MNLQKLIDTARTMVANDKRLLAMDESNSTCNKRFVKLGISQTETAQPADREMIISTRGTGEIQVAHAWGFGFLSCPRRTGDLVRLVVQRSGGVEGTSSSGFDASAARWGDYSAAMELPVPIFEHAVQPMA